ncbi:hypothetical protein V2J09_000502 [Rumex salicifolius]
MASAGAESVKLYGMWASPFVRRVELVLKVKGIPYEHVEEDLTNKSQDLLVYNPVHKKVPVLLHNGNPVAESLVIIEYIEDVWTDSPSVLPSHPYERAKVRFWATFIDLKILEQLRTVLLFRREEDMKEMRENMEMLEANVSDILPGSGPGPTQEEGIMGLLDILICTFSGVVESIEDALGVKIMEPNKYPLTFKWMKAFDGLQVVKDTTPSHPRLVTFFKHFGNN